MLRCQIYPCSGENFLIPGWSHTLRVHFDLVYCESRYSALKITCGVSQSSVLGPILHLLLFTLAHLNMSGDFIVCRQHFEFIAGPGYLKMTGIVYDVTGVFAHEFAKRFYKKSGNHNW